MIDIYTIPTVARETIEKAIARFQKKAEAYGKQITLTVGNPYAKQRDVLERVSDNDGYRLVKRGVEMVEVFDISIDSEVIRKDGYSVVAKIEHLDGGNIVKTFGGVEAIQEWHNAKARCQHCGGNHGQKITFIVRHEDGHEIQVGRTCLKDYCGIDPQHILLLNKFTDLLLNDDFDHYNYNEYPVQKAFSVVDCLAYSIRAIKVQGYVKADEHNSNRSMIEHFANESSAISDGEMTEAENLTSAISSVEDKPIFDSMLSSVKALINSGYCKAQHFGILAYAPLAYERYQEKLNRMIEREKQQQEVRASSEYVGEIGQRMEVEVKEMKLMTSWETEYGYTYLYRFIDINGNVLVWFASKQVEDSKAIKVTVKNHTERDGIKQTIITRCKAV